MVGGIGIVLDAAVDFNAMLAAAITHKNALSALFIDRSGRIIASSDAARPVGSQLDLDPTLLHLPNGGRASRIVIHGGHYAVMGCTVSHGYREFKVSDGYQEDIIAVVLEQFGEVRTHDGMRRADAILETSLAGDTEYATFFVNGCLLVKRVIKANDGWLLIQALDVDQLFACLKDSALPTLLEQGSEWPLAGAASEASLVVG